MKVTQKQFIDILRDTDEKYITVVVESPVKMNITGNPFYKKEGRSKAVLAHDVTKRYTATYPFGSDYKTEVEKRLRKKDMDDNYELAHQSWKQIIVPNRVCMNRNTGEYMLMYYLEDLFSTAPQPLIEPSTEYFVDGLPATDEQMEIIEQFEQHSSSNVKKQEDAGLSWEEQLMPRTLKFNYIIAAILGNENTMYELID